MKNYFKLSVSCEPKVIGVNNGVCQGNIIWKKFASKTSEKIITDYFSLKKFINNQPFIEPIDFEIEYVEAYKNAKMTDFFMYSPALFGVSYFITKKVVGILLKFNLPLSTFIPVSIYHKGVKYEYYAFYVAVHYREDSLDFLKSIFFDGIGFEKTKIITFNSKEDYLKNRFVGAEVIAFNKRFDTDLDLFKMLWSGKSYYISENLKRALEQAEVTGISIEDPINPKLHLA